MKILQLFGNSSKSWHSTYSVASIVLSVLYIFNHLLPTITYKIDPVIVPVLKLRKRGTEEINNLPRVTKPESQL